MNSEEQLVVDFLSKKGLRAEKFTKEEMRKSKTPDFRVFKENELGFFCEVKTISRDNWLEDQLNAAPPGTIVGGLRNDQLFNCVSNKIHEAAKQFDTVNPNLGCPNVLIFVNQNNMCGSDYLDSVISGDFVTEEGTRHPIYRQFSEGRIKKEKFGIHLYIWLDCSNNVIRRQHYRFNFSTPKEMLALCDYFSINRQDIKNLEKQHPQL